jgi:class 3 adenylate cyclase
VAICGQCGSENRAGAKFCNECAAPLVELAPLPPFEERKVVSVLFCDLVGFTASSERQDPEDVRARIRPYHGRLREEIERYGGTVEKFVGDAVMAVFGAPAAHEDDPERAVRAGLSILDAVGGLNDEDPGLELKVRVGVNTGEAVVALNTRPEEGEGLVTGDVVNTAARIEGAAPVNGVAVGEQTYRATSRIFEYEALGAVSVKGKVAPISLWVATRARARFGSDLSGEFKTPLVGRELEKALLIGVYERAAQQRSVQLVTVVGEPGVGKSRLVAELAAYTHGKPGLTRWRQGRCLPYGDAITFWALGEVVKAEAGILESDSSELAAAKLESAVEGDDSERRWLLQRLAPLVGADSSSPAERQELFTAWRRFLEGLAAHRTTVLVLEDLHWADDSLLEFVEYLAEWSQGVPLLILCTARPELFERRPGWAAGQRNAHTINLAPLSNLETAELVSQLLEDGAFDAVLQGAILERAGGNPLYAEEFVRLLRDRGVSVGEDSLPESVQALISARLDTLTADRKSLLQDAAVVGKVFWAGALAEIGNRDLVDVELALHELARKELVRPARASSMEGETEYSFWHVLVGDVAYSQIPRADRARRHRVAAAWIEAKAGDRVEDLAEVLAHHYLRALELAEVAGDREQAAEVGAPARKFLALAGERALGLDTRQAEARLGRALELTPSNDPQRAELLIRWADAAFQAGRPRDAAETLDDALVLLRARGETEATARALQIRSRVSLRIGEGRHLELAAEAVELLEQDRPGPTLVAAYEQLANAQCVAGAYAESIAAADRSRELAGALGLPEPARALGYRGFARVYLGDAEGLTEMERALELLIDQGAGRAAAVLQNNLAMARFPLRGPARAVADFEEGVAFCEQRGLLEPGTQLESGCLVFLVQLGRADEALERAARLVPMLEARGDTHSLSEVRAVEIAVRLARGEHDVTRLTDWLIEMARTVAATDVVMFALASAAAALADSAPEIARGLLAELEQTPGAHETVYYPLQLAATVRTALGIADVALARRLVDALEPRYPLDDHALRASRAQLAEHGGDLAGAAALYAEAGDGWQEFGNVAERAYALLGRGRCLLALDAERAEQALREARAIFASMGYGPAVAEVEALEHALQPAEPRGSSANPVVS